MNLHSKIFQHLLSVSKINEKAVDDAEDLVMMLYGYIQKMKEQALILILLTIIVLNLSSIRLNY